jgi:hypothetical protein
MILKNFKSFLNLIIMLHYSIFIGNQAENTVVIGDSGSES